jgi:hypothetical protein
MGDRVYMLCVTTKEKMREGFVAKTFHLPIVLDDRLRMASVKNHMKFSETVIQALEKYLK